MKRMLLALAAFSGFVVSNLVFAQSWCDSQDLSCQRRNDVQRQDEQIIRNNENPDDYGSSQPRIIYLPPKASQYGAVAENSKTGTMGKSSMKATARDARKAALNQCGERGCKILSTYANSCVAYAFVSNGHGFLRGAQTLIDANAKAMESCQADDRNCQIFISECSLS